MIAAQEVHHAVPRCLLKLWDEANGCIPDGGFSTAWLEFTVEAERWRVPVEIGRSDLARLIESSTEVLERERHRLIHASDWQRWGARGGREVVRRYGSAWMSALALKRWGRLSASDLDAMRVVR